MNDPPLRSITFTLPFAMPSLNVLYRMHWAKRRNEQSRLIGSILASIGGPRYLPRPPFRQARLTIIRHGRRQMDPDNLVGSAKGLVDCLCTRSNVHPAGLGIIADDNPGFLELHVHQQSAAGKPCTVVTVEELPLVPAASPAPKGSARAAAD